jgi:metallo-beta-lactamase family protein
LLQSKRRRSTSLGTADLFRLRFQGAAREVAGSRYLLETHRSQVLLECGMGQSGGRALGRDSTRWAFDAAQLDAVVLTHAHLDHSGMVPRLVKDGYDGPIHVTGGTADLLQVLWKDAAWIQEHETERTNRRLRRQARPLIRPLFTTDDADRALAQLRPLGLNERLALTEDVSVRFCEAGHILGAASLEVWVRDEVNQRRFVLSGDIGRADAPLMKAPAPIPPAELVLMESTYGDRNHLDQAQTLEEFRAVLVDARARNETVLIPVFAVGRAQEILYHIKRFEDAGQLEPMDVVLDSPMAINVTELSKRHAEDFNQTVCRALQAGETPFTPKRFSYARTADESMALNDRRGVVILAGSGMCQGGRIMHHLKHHLWRSGAHVVFVGFQARGTTGRALVDGAAQVKIRGQRIAVKANIHTIGGFSSHAGQDQLLDWYGRFPDKPHVCLIHGEEHKQLALAAALQQRYGVEATCPHRGDSLIVPKSGDAMRVEAQGRQVVG